MRIACLPALVFLLGCGSGSPTALPEVQKIQKIPPTVDEYKRVQIAATNEQLAAHSLRDLVETIHPGVTYVGASLTSLNLTTVDGSGSAGFEGANISEVHTVVVLRWTGPLTSNGFTEILTVYDRPAKLVKETRYLRSNAIINLASINWVEAGLVIVKLGYSRGLR